MHPAVLLFCRICSASSSRRTAARSSKSRRHTALLRVAMWTLCVCSAFPEMFAQDISADFRNNCQSCHTIGGGRLTGPDLKDVAQRKERSWLMQFIQNPKGMIDAGDPYAQELVKASRGVVMPTLQGMTRIRAEALLDLIQAESKLARSQFAGTQVSDRPFTPEDVEWGRGIFAGSLPLKNGGPACMSCHTVQGFTVFGGGTLAPDLTTILERYQGRKTLSAWLSAPQSPTMSSVYSRAPLHSDEVLAIVAYFQSTLARNPGDVSPARLNFILVGLAGTLLVMGLLDVIWGKRFRTVRRALVRDKRLEVAHE